MPTNKEQAELECLAATAELHRTLARFGNTMADRKEQEATATRPPEPKPPTKIVQLPLWPEAAPAAPNPVLRLALFPAIQGKHRRMLDKEPIVSLNGIDIKFTGKQLNQEDLLGNRMAQAIAPCRLQVKRGLAKKGLGRPSRLNPFASSQGRGQDQRIAGSWYIPAVLALRPS